MKKIVLALLLITTFACKNDKKATEKVIEKETPKEVVKEENIVFTINTVIPKNDKFILQYTEDKAFAFKAKDIVEVEVVGSNTAQDLVFKLPNKIIPTKVMLKVGSNNQDNVQINSVTIKNEDRKFEVNKNNFIQFFNPNKFIDYNRENKTYTCKKVDGKSIPAFVSRPLLIQKLEEKVY